MFRVWVLGFRVQGLGDRGLVCGVWGVGCGVWGVGFGIEAARVHTRLLATCEVMRDASSRTGHSNHFWQSSHIRLARLKNHRNASFHALDQFETQSATEDLRFESS